MGVLITVVSIVAGILGNQLSVVQAELTDRRESVYSIPLLRDDIKEIKLDIKSINGKIDDIIIARIVP